MIRYWTIADYQRSRVKRSAIWSAVILVFFYAALLYLLREFLQGRDSQATYQHLNAGGGCSVGTPVKGLFVFADGSARDGCYNETGNGSTDRLSAGEAVRDAFPLLKLWPDDSDTIPFRIKERI